MNQVWSVRKREELGLPPRILKALERMDGAACRRNRFVGETDPSPLNRTVTIRLGSHSRPSGNFPHPE